MFLFFYIFCTKWTIFIVAKREVISGWHFDWSPILWDNRCMRLCSGSYYKPVMGPVYVLSEEREPSYMYTTCPGCSRTRSSSVWYPLVLLTCSHPHRITKFLAHLVWKKSITVTKLRPLDVHKSQLGQFYSLHWPAIQEGPLHTPTSRL